MTLRTLAFAFMTAGAALSASTATFAQETGIPLGTGVYPESIAATPGGDLLVGSAMQGTVYRVTAGTTTATPWITGIGPTIIGVFAHGDTAYVCSNGPFGTTDAALKTYDLASGTETGSYPFPDGGFCSDIAVAPDGTVYVTHLQFVEGQAGRLLRLKDGALEVVLSDPAIRGVDGIAFLGDRLILNDLFTGALYEVNLGNEAATYAALTLSEPLKGPDGMRTSEDGRSLLITEQYGNRLVSVTLDGNAAKVTPIATDLVGPSGVAQVGTTAYVVEPHFAEMQKGEDPGPFSIRLVPLN